MFVWDDLIQQAYKRSAEKHACGNDDFSNPLMRENAFRDFQAWNDERKERGRQHNARRKAEHGITDARGDILPKQNRQSAERGYEPSCETANKAEKDRVHVLQGRRQSGHRKTSYECRLPTRPALQMHDGEDESPRRTMLRSHFLTARA
jgi:hypothetical protein